MGGFMPTPPAPAQPPQVKLDSTASSRGTFSNFLKNMNGATSLNPPSMAPSVGATAPTLAPASNIDIFNQPVAMMQFGGDPMDAAFSDFAGFSDSSDPFGGGDTSIDDVGSEEDPGPTISLSPATIRAGTSLVPENVFADDPAVVDRRGVNVGLESRGGFSAGVVPGLKGERFARFENVPFAMRGIARDFRSKINNAGDDGITVSNYFNTFNPSDDNKDRLAEFESLTGKKPGDKLNIGDMQNIMNIQAKYEAGIRDVAPSVQKAVLSTVNIDDDRKVEDILGSLDLGPLDKKSPTDGIDPFDIQPTFQNFGLPGVSGLPTVKSTRSTVAQDQARAIANLVGDRAPTIEEQLQQNVLADRGRALGPTTFSDDLANFQERVTLSPPPEGFEENVGVPGTLRQGDQIFAPGTTQFEYTTKGTTPQEQRELRELRDIDEAIEVAERGPLTFQTQTQKSTAPEDFEENVGLPFSDRRMRDIERLLNVPEGQRRTGEGDDPNILSGIPSALNIFERIPREQMAIDVALGRPRSLGEMIRGFTAPNIGMGQTKATDKETIEQFNQRTGRSIPENQLVRNDSGRIVAIKDATGRTVTGVDPNEPIGGGDDNQLPIIRRPIAPIVEDKKDDDKPPNIIGGTDPVVTLPVEPTTVVPSPFAPSDATFNPVTFDAGDLNKLIEALTGVAAKPVVAAQDGGLIRAVDDFIATAR